MENYVRPSDVHAPKRHWSLVQVLFDGGEMTDDNKWDASSLAIGRWDNTPVLAMRWNGSKDSPLGNPQSRGLATWFIIPAQHTKQILETEHFAFSDDKITFVRDFLESKRVYFVNRCPNPVCRDHQRFVLHQYLTTELESVLDKLRRDELKFYHIICDAFWKPTPPEKEELEKLLKAAWEQHMRGKFTVKVSARLRKDGMVLYSEGPIKDSPWSFEQLEFHLFQNSGIYPDGAAAFIAALKAAPRGQTVERVLPRAIHTFSAS